MAEKHFRRRCVKTIPKGQTLVEVAVVLPLLGLAIAVVLQLIFFCHNMIALQFMAVKTARQTSVEFPNPPAVPISSPLWGRSVWPTQKQTLQAAPFWRHFKAPASIQTAGTLALLKVQSELFPEGGFGQFLPAIHLTATVETPFEQPLPKGN